MKDALRRRRGQALDINIILGADPMMGEAAQWSGESSPDSEDQDTEVLGLAPEINAEEKALVDEVPMLPEEAEMEGLADVAGALGRDSVLAKALKSKRA